VHLPGFGVSPGGDRFDGIGDLASVVWWALEQLGLDRPVLAGHGLGATLAAEMAIQQPTAVAHLALATPFGLFDVDDTGVDVFALIPKDLQPHLYADPASELVLRHFPPAADAYERGLSAIRRVEVLGSTSRYLFPIPDTNVAARAYRLSAVPTTIWFGAADGVVPPSLAFGWSAAVPHADVRTVDGVAHMLPYELGGFADELLAAVRDEVTAS
jgi:pimeloyl-ACP methyl ester carboxylesterase